MLGSSKYADSNEDAAERDKYATAFWKDFGVVLERSEDRRRPHQSERLARLRAFGAD
jgi:hypothetical protein